MGRVMLIANPSSSGFTGGLHREVSSAIRKHHTLTSIWPNSAAEATDTAARAAKDGFDIVCAMGGDGVAHRVGNGLVDTDTALAVIPTGTTNVIARILGIPSKAADAAYLVTTGAPKRVPVASVLTERAQLNGLFAVGVGFDADVVERAEQRPHSKNWFGSVHYARAAIGMAMGTYRSRPPNLRIDCDGVRVDGIAVVVQVHNPYTYFGKIPISLTRDGGGGMTVLAIERMTSRVAASVLGRVVLRRGLSKTPGATTFTNVQQLIVDADPPTRFQADGEAYRPVEHLDIRPSPGALSVIVPE